MAEFMKKYLVQYLESQHWYFRNESGPWRVNIVDEELNIGAA